MIPGSQATFRITRTWDGEPAAASEHAEVRVASRDARVHVEIEAPFHDDPRPPGPPGCQPGLYDFEVVELFLLGEDERYLEVEVGPHGHHWVLALHGRRRIVREGIPVDLEVVLDRGLGRWRAELSFSRDLLPPGLARANAFAIHGVGDARRYLAAHAVPGDGPDFHRLGAFPAWEALSAR